MFGKKLIVEFPVYLSNQFFDFNEFEFNFSFPTIPSLGISPWKNIEHYKNLKQKPVLHLRSRDFEKTEAIVNFLKTLDISPNLLSVLIVFGDNFKNNFNGVAPFEAINLLKAIGFSVGCVFNPTPLIRSEEEEIASFLKKLKEKPDFVISQCSYNLNSILKFKKIIPKEIEVIACMGFWNKKTNLKNLGINNFDQNGNKCFEPCEQLILNVLKEYDGIYICDYMKKNCSKN